MLHSAFNLSSWMVIRTRIWDKIAKTTILLFNKSNTVNVCKIDAITIAS